MVCPNRVGRQSVVTFCELCPDGLSKKSWFSMRVRMGWARIRTGLLVSPSPLRLSGRTDIASGQALQKGWVCESSCSCPDRALACLNKTLSRFLLGFLSKP
jgi:hypothetical protein